MRSLNGYPKEETLHLERLSIQQQIGALLPRLRRFARNLTHNPHDADDVVQVALERALSRIEQRHADARLDSWLFKIVRNAWIDEVRSRVRWGRVLLPEAAGDEVGTDSMQRETDAMSVQAAMRQLTEEHRGVVSLVLIEGLPYKEAADVLDIPIGTLTSRLSRAREALQLLLDADGQRP